MPTTPYTRSILAVSLALALFPAHAQTQAEGTALAMAVDLEKVVVIGKVDYRYVQKRTGTATRTDTDLIDVPQAITVVTQDLIQDLAIQSMADAVRFVPGVGITQGEGNRDGLVFRGNSSTADLFIDGIRDDVQYYRDTYNIDRIEVLKGPNAMIFGRGSPGGLINRVTKVADWYSGSSVGLQFGSWGKQRLTADINTPINDDAAFRVTAVHEDSDGFRDGTTLERKGLNPTLSLRTGDTTLVTLGMEHFRDTRTADRGIPSYAIPFNGTRRPVATERETFFGDPDGSVSDAEVNALNAFVEHDFGNVLVRNRTRYAEYDKTYSNVFPGNVNTAATTVSLSAYVQDSDRTNLFNQTDLVFSAKTGGVDHTFLVGAELGRQENENLRTSGIFALGAGSPCTNTHVSNRSTSCVVPLAMPTVSPTVFYANNSSNGSGDARNTGTTEVAALYVQDQIQLTPKWHAIIGVRYDYLDLDFTDLRNGVSAANRQLSSSDNLLSPRVGAFYKPADNVSLYASYGVTYLPRSGEQLSSLTFNTQSLDPEEFQNYELGAKWDISPRLGATAAVYRLNRSNVAVVDPLDPTRLILFSGDSQRTDGAELSLSGEITDAWQVVASYTYQDAVVTRDIRTSATSVTPEGTRLAQSPRHMAGLWNRYDISPNWGVGLGTIYRSASFTTTSNAVTLKSYTRYDGAIFYAVNKNLDMQLNIENLFDKQYFPSAHSDNNITVGAPRGYFLSASLRF